VVLRFGGSPYYQPLVYLEVSNTTLFGTADDYITVPLKAQKLSDSSLSNVLVFRTREKESVIGPFGCWFVLLPHS